MTDDEIEAWMALKTKGYTNKAIAEQFNRDEKTVGRHLTVYRKRRGKESPDSELEALNQEKDRQNVLMALERVKEERMKVPQRLDELEATLQALVADQDQLRGRLESLPIANLSRKWKCKACGASKYVAVRVECTKCGYVTSWGHQCPPEKKVKPSNYPYNP